MPLLPPISDSEWEVMNILWDEAPLMACDIIKRLAGRQTWSARTIKTLLNRLVNKKALTFETIGKRYLYRPAVRRDQCVRAESRSFVSRVFGGAVGPMLVQFVDQAELSPDEIRELQCLLTRKGKASRKVR